MNPIVNQHYQKTCYKFVCWNCLNTWITNELSGRAISCPDCNSGNLSIRPMNRNDFKELKKNEN